MRRKTPPRAPSLLPYLYEKVDMSMVSAQHKGKMPQKKKAPVKAAALKEGDKPPIEAMLNMYSSFL